MKFLNNYGNGSGGSKLLLDDEGSGGRAVSFGSGNDSDTIDLNKIHLTIQTLGMFHFFHLLTHPQVP